MEAGKSAVLDSLCKEGNFVPFPEEGSFHEAEMEQTEEIFVDDSDPFYESIHGSSDNSASQLPEIATGDAELDRKLEEACREFSDIFSTELRKEPADIPPMKIELKEFDDQVERWDIPRNRAPARMQSTAKQNDLRKQIDAMLDRNVIKASDATAYSQVIMIPKPDHSWRFCVDYRYLNDLCKQPRWPIPNIRMMLNRIGAKRAMFYGLIDMTKGYYQAPLDFESWFWAAFITLMGIFIWLRVPMGLKGAPAYFQRMMATHVLIGLIYIILEVYMDDILVYATTADEFVENLRKVFGRLRKHRICINPKKCKLGLKHVQFVGHELSSEGVHWTSEKIKVVLDFPLPKTLTGLRAFLGLANYFRDHVKNHSVLAEPLQQMVYGPKHRILHFTEEQIEAFNKLKQAIADCPMLWFVDECSPIHLHTDACDFGIGAYLFQIIDGVERPIYFLSKALSKLQQRWSTFEKEAYAIYFTLVKLAYLLRDAPFVLHTDHKNLTFITTDSSAKVLRWKLYLQEHSYEIQYIPGPENVVADAFSRLCVLDGNRSTAKTLALLADIDSFPARPIDEFNHFIMSNDVYEKISRVHNELAGHHGVDRTVAKLNARNETWLGRRADVKNFIKHCPLCQKCQYDKVIANTVPFTNAAYEPMYCLNIDSIGPVKDDKHILVIICCFTRFVELFCVNDTTAKEAAKCLLAHFGRYGAPSKLKSDRGSQFVNDIIEEFIPLVGSNHVLTLAYSKEESGIVERANKEVMRHVRALVFEKGMQDEWETTLPLVQRIMNASVHSSIGVSPAQLLFGNSIDLDRGIFVPQEERDEQNSGKPLSPWMSSMLEKQQILLAKAQQNQLEHDTHHVARHSVSEEDVTVYPINSYVLVQYHDRPPSKLNTPLKGPMRVIAIDGSKYTLQDLVLDRIQHVHVSKLRPFVYDPARTDPRVVANKERESFDVDRILSHTGTHRLKSEMTFKTLWVGYSEEEATIQPWASLRDNVKLHQYLIDNNLKRLVPVKYRYLYPETFGGN